MVDLCEAGDRARSSATLRATPSEGAKITERGPRPHESISTNSTIVMSLGTANCSMACRWSAWLGSAEAPAGGHADSGRRARIDLLPTAVA
jgi:hypothetical protein